MTDHDRELAELLAPLRVSPPEKSTVDVEAAVRAGRARRRARIAAGGIAAVLVVLAGVLVPGLFRGSSAPEDVTPAGFGEFDPFQRALVVGSAGGYTPVGYETGRYRQTVQLGLERSGVGGGTVTVYARGRGPSPGNGFVWDGITRGGQGPSPVYYRHQGDVVTMAWEWQPGAWGYVVLDGPFGDLDARARRVAESVAPGGERPRFPFTVPAPGGGLRPVGIRGQDGEAPVLLYATGERIDPPGEPVRALAVGVRSGLVPGEKLPQTGELAGHAVSAQPDSFTVFGVGAGLSVTARADPPGDLAGYGGPGVVQDLAAAVELVPDPADPASWTANPVRA
ncbi:hypothetical protein [Amycolatopsis suaedae]|uniref:Uncharacterized protein n=1 Tax=Amycolatopsis suaedae TaxID=2510978 RepID=A0A4Q7J3H9_9PSEU|nr:hypothetical protein [Amycolatopsis suaedae]RZQ61517.1 hypothetical protein EWH70_24445 [Amycolatopsis suaedae]